MELPVSLAPRIFNRVTRLGSAWAVQPLAKERTHVRKLPDEGSSPRAFA